MNNTATHPIIDTLTAMPNRIRNFHYSKWKVGKIVDDCLVFSFGGNDDDARSDSVAVGLREMTLSGEAVKQLDELISRPSQCKIVPRDLPTV